MIAERRYVETEGKAELRVVNEQDELPRLVGAMMGAANDVSEHLADVPYPAHVTTFLRKFERLSWGQAGNYRKRKYDNPGAWCFFTLAKWVTITKLDKFQVAHIRQRVTSDGICFYHPNLSGERDLDGDIADGRLVWNLRFSEWKPLQPGYAAPKRGGPRPGAGRPKKQQPTIAKLNTGQAVIADLNIGQDKQETIANIDLHDQPAPLQERDETGEVAQPTTPELASGYTQNQTLQCLPDKTYSVTAMDASFESSADTAPEGLVIKGITKKEKKEKRGTPAVDQEGLPGMDYTDDELSLLKVLRELPTCAPNAQQDRHLLNALLYTEKYPLPWLIRQANTMVAWALEHPGKRKFNQRYFIQWCGFDAAQDDLRRWRAQQQTAQASRPSGAVTEQSRHVLTLKERAILAARRDWEALPPAKRANIPCPDVPVHLLSHLH